MHITVTTPVGTSAATAADQFTYTATTPPAISSAGATAFAVGTEGTFTVTATGSPPPSISETGALPSGVTFVNNGNGDGHAIRHPGQGHGWHLSAHDQRWQWGPTRRQPVLYLDGE